MNRRLGTFQLLKAGLAVATICLASGADARMADKSGFKRPDTIPFPSDNAYSPEKAALGKMLYFDPRLSGGSNMNCASCHNPSFGWEVPLAGAIGSQNEPLGRHAPTVLNMAWGTGHYFWDGRAATLEEQAKGPIQAEVEMNMPLNDLVRRLQGIAGYRQWFEHVFPNEGVSADTIAAAIATYERLVVSSYTPFDAWVDGDEAAISESAKCGFELFTGKAQCANCHTGWNFTDNGFHDIGLETDDPGRNAVTGDPKDQHAFKTPGLRELAQRAPFMHNGSTDTLEDVVWHYVAGGIARPSRSSLIFPLELDDRDVGDLVAFLETLSGDDAVVPLPILPN